MNINKVYTGYVKDKKEKNISLDWICLDKNQKEKLLYEVLKDIYQDLMSGTYYTKEELYEEELVPFEKIIGLSGGAYSTRESIIQLYHENKRQLLPIKDLYIADIEPLSKYKSLVENRLLLKKPDGYIDLENYAKYTFDDILLLRGCPYQKVFSTDKKEKEKSKVLEQYHKVF